MPASRPTPDPGGSKGHGASRRSASRWLPVATAIVFVLGMVAARWDARTGFTSLLSFGGPKFEHRLPVLRALPIARDPGTGYDGQFGAQLAVAPDPRGPKIRDALDNPAYRSRRILLSWTAHVFGAGNPWRVLQAYALQNVAVWLALSWLVWRELRPASGARSAAIWFSCMMTVGALDSIRLSLTDLPAILLLALAVAALAKGRPWLATGAFAVAGLTRETSLLGGAALWPARTQGKRAWILGAARCSCAVLPLVLWTGWLARKLSPDGLLGSNNFAWPAVAFVRHCAQCAAHLESGDFSSRQIFGLIGALGLGFQSVHVLLRPRWSEPWWRVGAGFALLLWVLGDGVWEGYWAASRALLPMTFAFSILLPDDRRFWPRLIFANAGLVIHGIWRMIP